MLDFCANKSAYARSISLTLYLNLSEDVLYVLHVGIYCIHMYLSVYIKYIYILISNVRLTVCAV